MNINVLIFIIILYILGSTIFRKLTFFLFDIIWRLLIIFGVYWFIKSSINISESQWLILAGFFVFNYIFTLINSPLKSPYYHLIGTVLAPLAEEFMFRGWLLYALSGSINERIIITSIFFGLYHVKNISYLTLFAVLYQICYAMLIGLPLAWLAISTHSLFFPILLHSINNALAASITMRYMPKLQERKKGVKI